jgi:hypothetical protein
MNMKRITDLNHTEAKAFFLKEESYFNFDLPQYFVFQKLLEEIDKKLNGKPLSGFYGSHITGDGKQKPIYPFNCENVNYILLNNKDGKFAWRPLQLIHPAIYIFLIQKITDIDNWRLIIDKFAEFQANPKIKCHSMPLQSDSKQSDKAITVSNWWQSIEQQSIELSLNFDYVLHTDITDCYGSIYTHSISWALHTKSTAKTKKEDKSLLGNVIDKQLQNMSYGQTNGIPQGSVLMDFIAEMVLGYADLELSEKIRQANIDDYYIIRYRDDYRIFSNNPQNAELITKLLTEILIELGMRLNAQKTFVTNNIVRDSIKPDKLYWITTQKKTRGLQEHLLLIHDLSNRFPNSGSLNKALTRFFSRIKGIKESKQNIEVLVSILVDIAYKNPKTYPIATAILSKLFSLLEKPEIQERILNAIMAKFDKIPNTGHIKLWLQRITIKIDRNKNYNEPLCEKVNNRLKKIWNSDWLNADFQKLLNETPIIDEQIINDIDIIINQEEIQLFKPEYDEDTSE